MFHKLELWKELQFAATNFPKLSQAHISTKTIMPLMESQEIICSQNSENNKCKK